MAYRDSFGGALGAIGVVACLLATSQVHAAEYSRPVTVVSTLSQAAVRPALPAGQNFVRIYVDSAAWGSSSCRQDAADLAKTDSHLIAQVLTALQSGKTIWLFVDDTLRPIDTVCQVTMVQVVEP